MTDPARISHLNENKSAVKGNYVLYWMQQSQRCLDNHALAYAIEQANRLEVPLLVVFGLTPDFPEANARHYLFMLQGLRHTALCLAERGIQFILILDSPPQAAASFLSGARLVVTDMGYLKIQRQWRKSFAYNANCPVIQVESDVIVPVETVSLKEQYSAATLRPRIHRLLEEFLHPVDIEQVDHLSLGMEFDSPKNKGVDISSLDNDGLNSLLKELKVDMSVQPVEWISGGTDQALKNLDLFIEVKLTYFHDKRNNPANDLLSNMSPYLHFGQISPITIALRIIEEHSGALYGNNNAGVSLDFLSDGAKSFLEELIIRRELSMNFTHFNDNYDSLEALHDWAKNTLKNHKNDYRPVLYTLSQFEEATTHDDYWNAAQKEMVYRGKMHGYMRMYWGKKIMEWSASPEEAFSTMVYLNNKYSLDGRDPNAYTGIAWCFGKHDRAWKEREIFGKVRYMNARGLERKFDIRGYVSRISKLCSD